MTTKWIGTIGKDFQRGCVYQLIALMVVVPLFALFILLPLFLANRPGVGEQEALAIMIVPAALFLFLLIGGGWGFVFFSIRKRARWMDEVFVPLGLTGSAYGFTGRQYHGTVRGREVDVTFVRGPNLSIHVSSPLGTNLAISDTADVSQNLARLFNKEPLNQPNQKITVFADEEDWGQAFISDLQARKLLTDLIFEEHPFLIRQIHFTPAALRLRLYRSKQVFDFRFTPEQGRHWVEDLIRLVEIAESLPAPREQKEESALLQKTRQGKLMSGKMVTIIVTAILAMALCVGGFALALVLLMEN